MSWRRILPLFLIGILPALASAQMVSGTEMPGFLETMGVRGKRLMPGLELREIGAKPAHHVLWSGENLDVQLEFTIHPPRRITLSGTLRTIGYRTRVPAGDIWTPHVSGTGDVASTPFRVQLSESGRGRVWVRARAPQRFGGFGLVADLGANGASFVGSGARVVKPEPGAVHEPAYAVDLPWPHEMSETVIQTFSKLGIRGCRLGTAYVPTTSPEYAGMMAETQRVMDWCRANHVSVMLTIGSGSAPMPLGRGRPWLRSDGTMVEGAKEDLAWLPAYDADFRRYVADITSRFGWPRGPVNAVELWNEPWEGVSISGWGADLPRYREIYQRMAEGVMEARTKGAKVLIGGASSSSNTRDKLFSDGSGTFLPWLDFVSVHYEGNGGTASQDKRWQSRTGEYGPVRVWDTESWVANSEDRIAGVVASMLSFGQQRAMGTYGGNVYHARVVKVDDEWRGLVNAWSPAAAAAAVARYIGQRPFRRLLFAGGLPFVFVFQSSERPDDGTVVVLGDMTKLYGPNSVAMRDAQLALPASGGRFTIAAVTGARLVDFAGNPVPSSGRSLQIPLNGSGFFLRTDGRPGSFARLLKALEAGRAVGYAPVTLAAKDFLRPGFRSLRVVVTNVHNRPVRGRLAADCVGRSARPKELVLQPRERREVTLDLPAVAHQADNRYPTRVVFRAGSERVELREDLHVHQIAARTIAVDGNLEDWASVLPLPVQGEGIRRNMTEEAWKPFQQAMAETGKTLTTGRLAYDARGMYFAAEITDPTPSPGGIRFATRDDDRYFYPEVSASTQASGSGFGVRWTGEITAPISGTYRMMTESDDGVRLWVNDRLVIDHWTDHGPTRDVAEVTLAKGSRVRIRLEYFQGGGGAEIRLFWRRPDAGEATIPGPFSREVFADRELTLPLGKKVDPAIEFRLGPDLPGVEGSATRVTHRWPDGVRRFSYRMDPDLPSGNGTDNVLIGFNVLPQSDKPLLPYPRGTFFGYTAYACTDYEYALNPVADAFGGGTEIWRLSAPGVPRKHFYPRQPKSPIDGGAVTDGRLVIRRVATGRIVECFLPWSEIPAVDRARRSGRTIKFSFRVNDNAGPAYELAQGRSVSKENPPAFHDDWATHWANELEFAFERSKTP
ncbi:MAG: PA14 domain-containing protein [Fimbriimonadaceae bacterium]|nr:PA14 domain-containing protein [Fimbriimonadaceae bacterium]